MQQLERGRLLGHLTADFAGFMLGGMDIHIQPAGEEIGRLRIGQRRGAFPRAAAVRIASPVPREGKPSHWNATLKQTSRRCRLFLFADRAAHSF